MGMFDWTEKSPEVLRQGGVIAHDDDRLSGLIAAPAGMRRPVHSASLQSIAPGAEWIPAPLPNRARARSAPPSEPDATLSCNAHRSSPAGSMRCPQAERSPTGNG